MSAQRLEQNGRQSRSSDFPQIGQRPLGNGDIEAFAGELVALLECHARCSAAGESDSNFILMRENPLNHFRRGADHDRLSGNGSGFVLDTPDDF